MTQHDFPGNVRELENILERAVALRSSNDISEADLDLNLPVEGVDPAGDDEPGGALPEYLDGIERRAIQDALAKTSFNRTAAAKLLGITFRQLRYRMQRLGVRDPEAGGGSQS